MLSQPKPIESLTKECSKEVTAAIEYVLVNYESLEKGKFQIPASEIHGIKLSYKPNDDSSNLVYERHREHVDLHIIMQGSEGISLLDEVQGKVTEPYNESEDYEIKVSQSKNILYINEKHGLVISSNLWHATGFCYENNTIEKVVLKIPKCKF